jgi:hypothetical protein
LFSISVTSSRSLDFLASLFFFFLGLVPLASRTPLSGVIVALVSALTFARYSLELTIIFLNSAVSLSAKPTNDKSADSESFSL